MGMELLIVIAVLLGKSSLKDAKLLEKPGDFRVYFQGDDFLYETMVEFIPKFIAICSLLLCAGVCSVFDFWYPALKLPHLFRQCCMVRTVLGIDIVIDKEDFDDVK